MRWQNSRRSENVEDQRGGALGRGPVALGGGGLLVVVVLALLFGVNPLALIEGGPPGSGEAVVSAPAAETGGAEAEMRDFVAAILGETEDVWKEVFGRGGKAYREPKLVLFSGVAQSACGTADAAVGPFYCPRDERVYLDLSFFHDLSANLGSPGDFAQAYVIAHEVGHHVQNLLGISSRVEAMRGRLSESEFNKLSVRLELQADFLAGVWAHFAEERMALLEPGDLEEALTAAGNIGDDRLQRRSQGYVVPDAFTHGTSEQRIRWFRLGFDTGDIEQGDTFSAERL